MTSVRVLWSRADGQVGRRRSHGAGAMMVLLDAGEQATITAGRPMRA